jgi:type IV pilus assembly protein PilE
MKRRQRPPRQSAFTLIEMMTVMLIVAILTTFAYPSYRHVKLKTARAEGRAALMRLMHRQERYYTEHHRYRYFTGEDGAGNNTSDASNANDSDGSPLFHSFSGETASASAYRLEARACESDGADADAGNCLLLRATPTNGLVDTACDVLTLDSTGRQAASGGGDCW